MRWNRLPTALLLFTCNAAIADSPLPPPSIVTGCNVAATHCATSDPDKKTTRLVEKSSGATLWSVDQYYRFFQVSNDGQAILAQSDFANLVPLNATKEHVLFVIYRNGKPIQSVPLGALFEGTSQLRRTVSHFSWGHLLKIDEKDNAVFALDDGRRIAYSLVTGSRVPQ
jgi:hypothetical protein